MNRTGPLRPSVLRSADGGVSHCPGTLCTATRATERERACRSYIVILFVYITHLFFRPSLLQKENVWGQINPAIKISRQYLTAFAI